MSTTESTAIDEKKSGDSGSTSDKADWKGFTKNFSHGLITGIFFGVVVIGSMGLFLAKVANANILPTDYDVDPYPSDVPEEVKVKAREVTRDIIYMNPVKILGFFGLGFWAQPDKDGYYIQEANFVNNNENVKLNFMNEFKNSWLCSLKDKAYPPNPKLTKVISATTPTNNVDNNVPLTATNSERNVRVDAENLPTNSPFWAYEFKTLKTMTCTSFSIINKIFFYMNYLPEWATMILFALFFSVIITIIYIANMITGIGTHITNFGEMINNLYNPSGFNGGIRGNTETPKNWWEKFGSFIGKICYVFVYFIGALYSALLISPGLVTFYAFFKALGASYVVRDTNYKGKPEDRPIHNVFSFIKSALYYKKTFILILVMLNLMGVTNEYLGTSYLPGVIIALIILIFGLNILVIDPGPISTELCQVLNPNFPPLKPPHVELGTTPTVDVCNVKNPISKPDLAGNTVSITGFVGSDVLQNISATNQQGGRKTVKKATITVLQKPTITVLPKTKTKLYNLKLV